MKGDGSSFTGDTFMVLSQKDWMLGDEEEGNGEEGRQIKSFRDAIKGRRNPVVEVEEEKCVTHSIEKKKESTREFEATIETITAWVHHPGLAIEYEENIFHRIVTNQAAGKEGESYNGGGGGSPEARSNREDGSRNDPNKPLVSQYSINNVKYMVEYKRLDNIYFLCGMVGYENSQCLKNRKAMTNQATGKEGEIYNRGGEGSPEARSNGEDGGRNGNNNKDKGKNILEDKEKAYGS
ncbi:hypothetical protein Ahy_A03g012862 [Arachis hypogaea]|uniref:Zinc knuckle CX2CX4HX4C domain-containing protein n=1 Tax=Arachis hypogaea TaxID=3818 RepID=A0A445DUC8_ARAHY|nr:hypothetical protein Ahy_A03g012862 [Arachis hypogaea]